MYDELVKRLRCQHFGNCPNCPMWYTEEVEPNLWRERCAAIDAADAIEELQATLCNWCAVCSEDKRDLSTCEIYESCRAKPPKEE